jgi:hypothetical protein
MLRPVVRLLTEPIPGDVPTPTAPRRLSGRTCLARREARVPLNIRAARRYQVNQLGDEPSAQLRRERLSQGNNLGPDRLNGAAPALATT